jgi:peptidoglycan/LPS O-acetylase OafA/YrhL
MQAQHKIRPLTSLRFFAALFVIFYHTIPSELRMDHAAFIERFIGLGFTAVSFFFTLSGYILAIVYLSRGAALSRRRFWLARFARIYPLFVLTLILDAPNLLLYRISVYGIGSALAKTGVTFLANLAMLQPWILKFRGIDNPNWSLAVEAVFYLIFPFIAYSLWHFSPRAALILIGIAYIVAVALPYLGTRLHINLEVLAYNPVFHLPEFIAGILLARWHTNALADEDRRRALQKWCVPLVFLSICLFGVVVRYAASIPFVVIHDGLLIPVSALSIISFASGNQLLERIFSNASFVVLGEASYSMYLIHIPVWHLVERAHLGDGRFFPIYLLIVLALSLASFYWLETPLRHWILKRSSTTSRESLVESSLSQ